MLLIGYSDCLTFNDQGMVPEGLQIACIVPLYKGKGDKNNCSNSRRIRLLVYLVRCMGGW